MTCANLTRDNVNLTRDHVNLTRDHVNLTRDYANLTRDHVNLTRDYVNLTRDYANLTRDNVNLTRDQCYKNKPIGKLNSFLKLMNLYPLCILSIGIILCPIILPASSFTINLMIARSGITIWGEEGGIEISEV